ncbi:hypothetical protein CLOM_g2295 [Closterium sp. NIES-68]|nr:hypothetical protein CLOM_g2295 [Closterium sp. NIES-68]GJP84218.1 hypothetical protein CLOP_g14305 [Closterium sp. NIES-67]
MPPILAIRPTVRPRSAPLPASHGRLPAPSPASASTGLIRALPSGGPCQPRQPARRRATAGHRRGGCATRAPSRVPQPLPGAIPPRHHQRLSPPAMATPYHHSAPRTDAAEPRDPAKPNHAAEAVLEARNERGVAEVARLGREEVGVVVVDHGSRREESNRQLDLFVEVFQEETGYAIVEPAHMEIAEPSIAAAFTRCVRRGARGVIVCPYFLSPGRHWQRDIPALAAEAAAQHGSQVPFIVTAPIGVHPLVAQVLQQRISHCLQRVAQADAVGACNACRAGGGCMEQKSV